jgi:hypothetical protein
MRGIHNNAFPTWITGVSHRIARIFPDRTEYKVYDFISATVFKWWYLLMPGPFDESFGAPLETKNYLNPFVVMKNVCITKLYYLSPKKT